MSIQFHKIWVEQCEATVGIRERFGLDDALNYLIGEKLFHFVQAAEQHPEFAAELPAFVAEIREVSARVRSRGIRAGNRVQPNSASLRLPHLSSRQDRSG